MSLISILMIFILLLSGCSKPADNPIQAASGDALQQENQNYQSGNIEIPKVENKAFCEEDMDGKNSFASMTIRYPKVSFSNNDTAEKAINSYFYELVEQTRTTMDSFAATAKQEYQLSQNKDNDYNSGYYVKLNVKNQGICGRVLSFTIDTTTFSGGAHPETYRSGVNFDLEQGDILTYKDIVTDEKEFHSFAKNYLIKALQTSTLYSVLFEDYQDAVDNFLCEGSFTLTQRGLDFWCNPYLAWPYSGGIHRFTIPYEDMDRYLVEQYQQQ